MFLWCPSSSNRKDECPVTVRFREEPPSALEFLRDCVSLGRPLIIRHAVSFCCTVSDLVYRGLQMEHVVDVEPDGYADDYSPCTSLQHKGTDIEAEEPSSRAHSQG
jgi:hypothetical protein